MEKVELLKQQEEMKIIQKRVDMLRNINLFVTDIKDDFLTESFFRRKDISKQKKEELDKLKRAAQIENYASYSEFIRRTSLKEATKILNKYSTKNGDK